LWRNLSPYEILLPCSNEALGIRNPNHRACRDLFIEDREKFVPRDARLLRGSNIARPEHEWGETLPDEAAMLRRQNCHGCEERLTAIRVVFFGDRKEWQQQVRILPAFEAGKPAAIQDERGERFARDGIRWILGAADERNVLPPERARRIEEELRDD
jgi:hypothetical protein